MAKKKLSALLTNAEAAAVLRRAPQTLRKWASVGGPIDPVRVNGKGGPLTWRRSDIEALIGCEITEDDLRTNDVA